MANETIDLGLELTDQECFDLMRIERGYIENHIKQFKKDSETIFNQMKHKVHLLHAYNRLIASYEKHNKTS